MINSIVVTNHLDEVLTMELASPEQSGLVIFSVDGLGPSKGNISLTERAGIDGALYNSSRVDPRNVIFQLKFLPLDIQANRLKSYRYFPLKRNIKIEAFTPNRNAYVYGRVETNEPDIFSKEAGCVISMLCPESYLYDLDEQITVFSSITGGFQFPFANNDLVSPELTFGDIDLETEKTIVYMGDSPIGMLIHIHATGVANGFVLTNSDTLETLAIDSTKLAATTGSDIIAGDDIYISTVKGNKYATLLRGSTPWNILNCLGSDPTWFELEKGDNVFAYTAVSGIGNLEFKVTNKIAYEGI